MHHSRIGLCQYSCLGGNWHSSCLSNINRRRLLANANVALSRVRKLGNPQRGKRLLISICTELSFPHPSLVIPWVSAMLSMQTTFLYVRSRPAGRHNDFLSGGQAIDLMTRRLIASGQRPVTVGTFFSLGHSTFVLSSCHMLQDLAVISA